MVFNSLIRLIRRIQDHWCRIRLHNCSRISRYSLLVAVSSDQTSIWSRDHHGILVHKSAAQIVAHLHALPPVEVSTDTLAILHILAPPLMQKKLQLDRRPQIA